VSMVRQSTSRRRENSKQEKRLLDNDFQMPSQMGGSDGDWRGDGATGGTCRGGFGTQAVGEGGGGGGKPCPFFSGGGADRRDGGGRKVFVIKNECDKGAYREGSGGKGREVEVR